MKEYFECNHYKLNFCHIEIIRNALYRLLSSLLNGGLHADVSLRGILPESARNSQVLANNSPMKSPMNAVKGLK